MGAKAAKLGLGDKHPAYCQDWNVDMCLCAVIDFVMVVMKCGLIL